MIFMNLMINMNSEFYREHSPGGQEYLFYKGRMVLFAINYERTYHNEMDYNKYRLLPLEAIKSVYISRRLWNDLPVCPIPRFYTD